MKMYPRSGEKRRFDELDMEEEEAAVVGSLCRLGGHPESPVCAMENEKRIRREIANSNERRRMQSINAGFASLKQLLPHTEGEKLSKAAILQQTADYIFQLESERKDLIQQNTHLKKVLNHENTDGSSSEGEGPLSEILSSIHDLHNTPTNTKLANTEPQKLTMNNTNRNQNNVGMRCSSGLGGQQGASEGRRTKSRDCEDEHTAPEEVAAVEELSSHDDVTHYTTVTSSDVVPANAMANIRMELDRERRHSSNLEDKVRALTRNHPSHKVKDYRGEECIKNEPMEYSPVTFGVDDCEQVSTVSMSNNNSTVLDTRSAPRCFTLAAPHNHHNHQGHPNTTTIVTILPPTPPHPNSVSTMSTPITKVGTSVLEVVTSSNGHSVRRVVESSCVDTPRVEVEPASRIPTPDDIEYSTSESPHPPLHHHDSEGYAGGGIIVTTNGKNGNGQSCQKSLDTICEAIRHLEGDHMFSAHDDHNQMNRIEEEVITDETFAIQDSTTGSLQDESAFMHADVNFASNLVRHTKDGVYEICSSPPSGQQSIQHRLQFHPATTMVYGIDEHLVSSEPQEVPLELTTSHRIERIECHSPPHSSTISSASSAFSSSSSLMQSSRPGVIVVKQA